jgi:hypothetical protein
VSPSRLALLGAATPTGPDQDSPSSPKNQGARSTLQNRGRLRRARRPRRRVRLLKGCRQAFRPEQPTTRYCSEKCREEARRWRLWKARHRYRQSQDGKQKRQAQSRRFRERRKQRQAPETTATPHREGHPYKFFFEGDLPDYRPRITRLSGPLLIILTPQASMRAIKLPFDRLECPECPECLDRLRPIEWVRHSKPLRNQSISATLNLTIDDCRLSVARPVTRSSVFQSSILRFAQDQSAIVNSEMRNGEEDDHRNFDRRL